MSFYFLLFYLFIYFLCCFPSLIACVCFCREFKRIQNLFVSLLRETQRERESMKEYKSERRSLLKSEQEISCYCFLLCKHLYEPHKSVTVICYTNTLRKRAVKESNKHNYFTEQLSQMDWETETAIRVIQVWGKFCYCCWYVRKNKVGENAVIRKDFSISNALVLSLCRLRCLSQDVVNVEIRFNLNAVRFNWKYIQKCKGKVKENFFNTGLLPICTCDCLQKHTHKSLKLYRVDIKNGSKKWKHFPGRFGSS